MRSILTDVIYRKHKECNGIKRIVQLHSQECNGTYSIALLGNGIFYSISRDHKQPIKWSEINKVLYNVPYFIILICLTPRAQNNGRSTDNERPKMPLDRSLFYLTGHFDRPHFHGFQSDCWRLESKHETMMYRNKFLILCFTVSVSVY